MLRPKQGTAMKVDKLNHTPAPNLNLKKAANLHVPSMRNEQLVWSVVGHLVESV